MSELENMLSSKIYDPMDPELMQLRSNAHRLNLLYNQTFETEFEKRKQILDELLPNRHPSVFLQGPIYFDYGKFTKIGENSYANFNLTILDCAPVTIGKNVFMGPNVSLYPPIHPKHYEDRHLYYNHEKGYVTDKEAALPIVIEDDCWLAGNVVVCGGVTIGRGSVIGAGSVVTRDIPPMSFAAGNPARVIRQITEADKL